MSGGTANNTPDKLLRRVAKAGFPQAFIREAVLPDWWDSSCDKDPALLNDLELRIARFLAQPLAVIRDAARLGVPDHKAQLRKTSNLHRNQLSAPVHASLQVAAAVLRSLKTPLPDPALPPKPEVWRDSLLSGSAVVGLPAVVEDLWARGIPVIHVDLPKLLSFQGLAGVVANRPVIVLGSNVAVPARQAFYVAHEAAHHVHGDCIEGTPVVDEGDEYADLSGMEIEADSFARRLLHGTSPALGSSHATAKELAREAEKSGQQHRVDPGALIWSWAGRHGEYAMAQEALAALYVHVGASRALRRAFDAHVEVEGANETDRALLRCVSGDPSRDATAG